MTDLADLRVCFISGTLGQGGAERQLYYAVAALVSCGANVTVLSLTRGEFWEPRLRALGAKVDWTGPAASRMARLRAVTRALRSLRPSLVQSQHLYANLYAALGARLCGIREIGALRGDAAREVRSLGWPMGILSLRMPRLIAANSAAGVQGAQALGVKPARLHLLANVVDATRFQPVAERRAGPLRVLAVGRLTREKRLDRFLRVLAAAASAGACITGQIVGDGPDRGALESEARRLGLLPGGVEFRGALPDASVAYSGADVLVLTSDAEGTPNVVLEAMATGLPVVATTVGDVPDLVRSEETGFLVAPTDEERMAEHLWRLAHDRELRERMGRKARERVVSMYSLCGLPTLLQNLYARALP